MNDFITLLPTLLIAALALIMVGLGLSLTVGDFRRLLGHPKAVLLALALIAFAKEWDALTASFATVGLAVLLFNAASLGLGYCVPRIAGLDKPNAVAIG